MRVKFAIIGVFLLISILSGCVFYGGYDRPYHRAPRYYQYYDHDRHDHFDRHDRDRDRW